MTVGDGDLVAARVLRLFTVLIGLACVALVFWIAMICVQASRSFARLDRLEDDVRELRSRLVEVPHAR